MAGTLSHLAEPSNALRKKEHLADYWIYLCVDSHFAYKLGIDVIPFYSMDPQGADLARILN